MSPPQLAGNAPVLDVFQPLLERVVKAFRHKRDSLLALLVFEHLVGERAHLDKPLFRQVRLHDHACALGMPDLVRVLLDVVDHTVLFKIGHERLAAFEPVHAFVLVGHGVHRAVVVHADRHVESIFFREREVVGVVSRRTFHDGRSKFHVDVVVGHDWQRLSVGRVDGVLANQVLVALVVWMNEDRLVGEHRFRARRGDDEFFPGFHNFVFEVIHVAHDFLVLNFDVAQRGAGLRIPVDDALALVNQPVVVQVDKHFANGLRQSFIHCEALARVVKRQAKLGPLFANGGGVFLLPLPRPVQKFLAADVVAGNSLVFEAGVDFGLRRDAGMIHTGQPQHVKALQALVARQDILDRRVPGVSEMELASYIGWRDDDTIRALRQIPRGKIPLVNPLVIAVFLHFRVVVFWF